MHDNPDREHPTEIYQKIHDAFDPPKKGETGDQDFPTMDEVAIKKGLGDEQRLSYNYCCAAVMDVALTRLMGEFLSSGRRMPEEQHCAWEHARRRVRALLPEDGRLFQFTAGSAGTGKRRVVDAVCEFARRWRVRDAIVVSATSGLAGSSLCGSTWHTALGLQPIKSKSDKPLPLPKEVMKQRWSRVGLVLVDEISMASPEDLQLMHERMCALKDNHEERFGGVHVAVFGDFQQLPAITSDLMHAPTGTFSLRSASRI
jgi:hypothetical protein